MLPISTAYGIPLANNEASTMCVDCHTVEPVNNGGSNGSHFVVHNAGGAEGFRTTNNSALEYLGVWSSSGGSSKYASPAPPDVGTLSVTGQTGEMICESCHNLLTNIAGGNNLLAEYATEPSVLCEGCHAGEADGTPNHHPLTGDLVGTDNDVSGDHPLNITHITHLYATPVAGSEVAYPVDGVETDLNCFACHKVHGGGKGTGARILRRGYSATSTFSGSPVNLVYYDFNPQGTDYAGTIKEWDTGTNFPGVDRQSDVENDWGTSARLVINQDPLCESCHR
ncbi:MAG: hypothetical protein C0609_07555 [Deltaproteobacteria bacterium]|nr:MAG: hypothetical protein C0609_07555 [Deltaproteobacteria bacterium]